VKSGSDLQPATLLFSKIEDEIIEKQVNKLVERKRERELEALVKEETPIKELVSFEDFSKMDIRIGRVLEAEKVKKADKLLLLKVDTGVDIRTIVSGIAHQFSPEEIVNKQVVVLLNLSPRKIRGVESHGMLLMAENGKGELGIVQASEANSPGDLIG
jgi:methionyl-tRNA synthetase